MAKEVTRKSGRDGTPYRVMNDVPQIGLYCIEYAKTFMNKGDVIYGWYPMYEPQKYFMDKGEVMDLFNEIISK